MVRVRRGPYCTTPGPVRNWETYPAGGEVTDVAEQTYVCSHCGKEVKKTDPKERPSCCGVPMEKKG